MLRANRGRFVRSLHAHRHRFPVETGLSGSMTAVRASTARARSSLTFVSWSSRQSAAPADTKGFGTGCTICDSGDDKCCKVCAAKDVDALANVAALAKLAKDNKCCAPLVFTVSVAGHLAAAADHVADYRLRAGGAGRGGAWQGQADCHRGQGRRLLLEHRPSEQRARRTKP